MKVLCIDLSTHMGWAVLEGHIIQGDPDPSPKLLVHGTAHIFDDKTNLVKLANHLGYPANYRRAADIQAANVLSLMVKHQPDAIVIEETNGGRNRYTQKLLEFLHYRVTEVIHQAPCRVVYLDSSEWRSNLGLKMTKEQKKANAKLRKAMREAVAKGEKVVKKKLGIKGLINPKHVAVNHANTTFGLTLKMKDNDAADAICLGLAFFNNAVPCDGV